VIPHWLLTTFQVTAVIMGIWVAVLASWLPTALVTMPGELLAAIGEGLGWLLRLAWPAPKGAHRAVRQAREPW
jgi:hypothetical protein